MKKRILMVLGNTGRGGSQGYTMNILRNIDSQLFEVDFAVYEETEGGYGDEIRQLGGKIWLVPRFNGVNYYKCLNRWESIYQQGEYDIVHGHATNAAFIYLKAAQQAGIKTIIHSHSAGFRGNRLQQRIKSLVSSLGPKYADYWFACSAMAAKKLYGAKFRSYPFYYLIPNAIEVSKYSFNVEIRQKTRAKYGIDDKTKVIGHLGSFSMPKNHRFIIEIFKEIHKKNPDSILMLCGDGPLYEKVKKKIQDENISSAVIMTGNIPNVADHLMCMDIMVFPSLFEGLPVSLVEAQATGLPVVKSDTITDEVNITDIICSQSLNDDSSIWCDTAVNMSVSDRDIYNKIVNQTSFNIRNSILTLQNLYLSLIEKK